MKLNADQISKYIIKSLRESPEMWKSDGFKITNNDLDCSVWICNGTPFIEIYNYSDNIPLLNSLKPSFWNSLIINFLYLTKIEKKSSILIGLYYFLKIITIFPILAHDYSLYRDDRNGNSFKMMDFQFSKNYTREERFKKLLDDR